MKTILIEADVRGKYEFGCILRDHLLNFNVAVAPDSCLFVDVEYVVFWRNIPEYLNSLPNLKALIICGSGIDHLNLDEKNLPNVPIVRLVDSHLKLHVAEYVEKQIVNCLALMDEANDYRLNIGIMGYGQIGRYLGQFLREKSHNVSAWCKHPKSSADLLLFSGIKELEEFLENLDVLICALPLTNETSQILNTRLFNKLKTSCYLINIGRGGHLNDSDLLEALTSKQLLGACLDVVNSDSTLLSLSDSRKKELHLTITPHIAGFISAESQAPEAIKRILELESGVVPQTLVNFNLKY